MQSHLSVIGCCLLLATPHALPIAENFEIPDNEHVSLLQLKVVSQVVANASRSRDSPGNLERQMCPHEIEEAEVQQGSKMFGCQGTLRAEGTKECSFWGEPHMSKSWASQLTHGFDVLSKPGLFRMAAAEDGSWEVQMFNCGAVGGSLAARFGKNVIEVTADAAGGGLNYWVNGERYHGSWPIEQGQLFVDNTHRRVNKEQYEVDPQSGGTGACIDDPGGQIYVEVYRDPTHGNINVLMEAADGSFTNWGTDHKSLCNVNLDNDRRRWKKFNWPNEMVNPEDSLFMASGNEACAWCQANNYFGHRNAHVGAARATCAAMTPTDFKVFTTQSICDEHEITLASAQAACVHLQSDSEFFNDCQIDYCASDGNPASVANAEAEEHAENPQPICAIADDACDPAASCCNALRDKAILDFGSISQNNLCGDGAGAHELRYGAVLTQQGQVMDLVVTPVGDYDCGRATNDKNGAKSEEIGVIAVQTGKEATLNFAFVSAGTDTPATPSSVMFSFLDLDQGKKDKQRESVEVCGAVNAIVTDNSELEQSNNGDCIKFTSTTAGTGRDNPENVESMSSSQRARVVAYQITGSSFTATLGVSKKGHNPRRFMFAGNPSVACVLK